MQWTHFCQIKLICLRRQPWLLVKKGKPGFLWKLSPDLIIGNRLQAVRYNFASQIESSRRRRKNLAHTIRVSNWPRLCRCFVCCKALVGTNLRCKKWFASILGSRLGKSIWLHFPRWPDCCSAALRYPWRFLRHYTCNIQRSKVCCARCWTYVQTKAATFWHITSDVHYHPSCSQSWWPCSSLTRRLNSQWKLKPGNPVSFLSMNWFMLTIHWWLPRALVEQKHIWDALKQREWIMVSASTGRNARYYLLGAKLPLQPLTELPYMQIIHLISGKLFGCHWRWWPRNLQAIRWSQRSIRQTRESLAGILPCTPQQKIRIFQVCVVSSRVESSLYAKKWRAPLVTGVQKEEMKREQIAKYIQEISLHSKPAEADEVVQVRFPPVLVFSSIHPISQIFVATISNQFVFPSVCRTSGIARPRRSQS